MKYNKSEIMKAAWVEFKKCRNYGGYWGKKTFGDCLRKVWADAKRIASVKNHFMTILRGCTLYIDKGVIAGAGRMGWNVTGKTFAVKNDLRKMGFRWDCEARCWYTEDAATAAKLA